MSRTYREPKYKYYYGMTDGAWQRFLNQYLILSDSSRNRKSLERAQKDFELRKTESRNRSAKSRWFYNQAHRTGRRLSRDRLRPQYVEATFDDSRFICKYKGVKWEID